MQQRPVAMPVNMVSSASPPQSSDSETDIRCSRMASRAGRSSVVFQPEREMEPAEEWKSRERIQRWKKRQCYKTIKKTLKYEKRRRDWLRSRHGNERVALPGSPWWIAAISKWMSWLIKPDRQMGGGSCIATAKEKAPRGEQTTTGICKGDDNVQSWARTPWCIQFTLN